MDELIKAMSSEDIEGLKAKYSDNPSVVAVLDGVLESRAKELEQAKATKQFTDGITKLFAKLPHPDDIMNVYVRWCEVEVIDGEPEEVEVDGERVMREPCHKEYQWVVETNHAVRGSSATGNGEAKASKRAVTIFKRNGTNLEPKGNYASASKACETLGLQTGGDSANRVLTRNGYIVEPYDTNIIEGNFTS